MRTVFFFQKERIGRLAGIIAVFFVLSSTAYAYILANAATVGLYKSFYFLVSPSTHIQASTHLVGLSGGAGYTLTYDDREYVAFSVYLDEKSAQTASVSVSATGEESELLVFRCEKLYFKSAKAKQNARTVKDDMQTLYSYIGLLNGEIARLEKGATQESSARILKEIARGLLWFGQERKEDFSACSAYCEKAATYLKEEVKGTIYTKDLRYLLCELCVSYMRLADMFTL